jgi:hypothetical protein
LRVRNAAALSADRFDMFMYARNFRALHEAKNSPREGGC